MRHLSDKSASVHLLNAFKRLVLSLIIAAIGLLSVPVESSLALPSSLSGQQYAQASVSVAQELESTAPIEGETVSAASLFTKNCAGCHAHGGNVVRRGKNLKQRALKRYGYDNVTRISQIVTNGKGIMSAYGDRLTPEEIGAIAQYVLTQAEIGW